MKDIKILIIPDVHGRTFWKEPVNQTLQDTEAKIIFLGDYIDGYPHEWSKDVDYRKESIERLKEILELKKQYPERITLLIGNHDCGYCIDDGICSSRMDYYNRGTIERLFRENRELFQLADSSDIAGRHFVFSHAGILKGWVSRVWGDDEMNSPGFNIIDELNNAWLTNHYGILNALGIYDRYRGWGGGDYGSPVWSDIRSWVRVTPEETFGFNIAGHTQLEDQPIILDTIADLDCRKAFYLDSDGNIRDYETDEVKEKTRQEE